MRNPAQVSSATAMKDIWGQEAVKVTSSKNIVMKIIQTLWNGSNVDGWNSFALFVVCFLHINFLTEKSLSTMSSKLPPPPCVRSIELRRTTTASRRPLVANSASDFCYFSTLCFLLRPLIMLFLITFCNESAINYLQDWVLMHRVTRNSGCR